MLVVETKAVDHDGNSVLKCSRRKTVGQRRGLSAKGVNLYELGERSSPIVVLDDFRVSGRPFRPHPHAGFSAITYVFENSQGGVRSRNSLGNDVVVGPGGIVWLQAASGALHQEVPAQTGGELYGAQIFVNLSSTNKLAAPRTLWLENSEVPEWRSGAGDRIRIVVGSYEGLASPLVPAEPFNLLDVALRREISFSLQTGHYALVYVRKGGVLVRVEEREQRVPSEHALASTAVADEWRSKPFTRRIYLSCRAPRSASRSWWMGPSS